MALALCRLQWGRVVKDAEICPPQLRSRNVSVASMGPRRERRGNISRFASQCWFVKLQWGRVVKDAEICGRIDFWRQHGIASMGPRRERRGNVPVADRRALAGVASMGPRRERRGNGKALFLISCISLLQWGRVVKDAEICVSFFYPFD